MNKYEVIAEALQEKVYNGELTLEDANIINDVAYDKYVTESSEDKFNLTDYVINYASHHRISNPRKLFADIDEDNPEKLIEAFKRLDFGIVAFDDSNYLLYSFKSKTFTFFDHEQRLSQNLFSRWSHEKSMAWLTELFNSSKNYDFKYEPFKGLTSAVFHYLTSEMKSYAKENKLKYKYQEGRCEKDKFATAWFEFESLEDAHKFEAEGNRLAKTLGNSNLEIGDISAQFVNKADAGIKLSVGR